MRTSNRNKQEKKPSIKKGSVVLYSPLIGRAIVGIAHKLSSIESKGQLVKIEGKYYRIKELG